MNSQNLFNQLEKTKPTDKKNQTEDYFTKILQFVLLNNKNIRREFLKLLFKKQPSLIKKYRSFINSANETDILSHTTASEGIPDLLIGNDRTPRLAIEIKLECPNQWLLQRLSVHPTITISKHTKFPDGGYSTQIIKGKNWY